MDNLYSIMNFEEGGAVRDVNSPRTLEACLMCGIDPAELKYKKPEKFISKTLTEEMTEKKYATFERKRKGNLF